MEIENFNTKYALHTIPEFVKYLNSSEQEQPPPQPYIFNTVIQRDNTQLDQYPEEKSNEPIHKNYKIIKYNKKALPKTMYSTCGLIRSVVVNASNKVVSFSPPKCISYEEFFEKNPIYNENIIVEELVEGTMIQLFWDSYECKWEIATKSSIGGHNTNTFSKKTFRDMFFDALKEIKLT